MASIRFLGAAGEVTGSCTLFADGRLKFLVDCGMFQGGHDARGRNERFAFDPREIAFVLLTHAHIDHSGLLPRLAARGFTGPVYATPATAELLEVMLPDSAHLQEREAEHEGGAPLYTLAHAQASLALLRPAEFGAEFRPAPGLRCVFRKAGHILGSAIVELHLADRKVVCSGDLGQPGRPIVEDAETIAEADVVLVESTYGNRNHKSLVQTLDELAYAVNDTLGSKRGNVVMPCFAVGRTQEILYYLAELRAQRRIPAAAVYVDSPMATAATRITLRYARLPLMDGVRFTESLEESKRINAIRDGAIILSASGMCEGGRIRHHLRYNISRPECAIVFPGFQAAGTLGRRIVDGAESVRLFRDTYPVRAKVFTINGLSAHADRDALLGWIGQFRRAPAQAWVVHGEPLAAHALRDAIVDGFGWRAEVPSYGQEVQL
ncbi:MAG TPA: MBL fold metallo-hydrolase [Burkholderiales bacterium]|nr:MBL fold metallo-hydrolase [Burkholderiales bacterium]